MFGLRRVCDCPGYHFFESESKEHKEENAKILGSLSLYTKFRVFIEIVIYEYLCHFSITRWLLIIGQIFIALLGLYPILPLLAFGKKFAFVEIMKTKKSN